MGMSKRPASVSVIAWIIIVTGGLIMPVALLTFFVPEMQRMLEINRIISAWAVLNGCVVILSGIAMLQGLNWGRLPYLWFIPISLVLGWLIYGFHGTHILTVTLYIVMFMFLTRTDAKTFFISRKSKK